MSPAAGASSGGQAGPDAARRDTLVFPPDFMWGAATAAYQIEGAADDDGKGRSIWDTFAHTPGRIANGDTGDIAADHYHRYKDDVGLLSVLGLNAYRFSVSWPRIQADGTGAPNPAGLDYYDRLVDTLLERAITPLVTLYHWDLPQALEDREGWRNRDTAYRFAEYAEHVGEAIGDRIRYWVTINEPWCAAFLGYSSGVHAPGVQDPAGAFAAAHHLMLAHGLAAPGLRASNPGTSSVGVALNFSPVQPRSESAADLDAARRIHLLQNRLFADPILRGSYGAELREHIEQVSGTGHIRPGDEDILAGGADFLGVNYYTPYLVSAGPEKTYPTAWPGAEEVAFHLKGLPRTVIGWEVDPDAFRRLFDWLSAEYPDVDLVVTENGVATFDRVDPDGAVHDPERIDFLFSHLRAVHAAIADGANIRGYFTWSLMDNFEWAEGYAMRFGLVFIDYETQQRFPKDSAHWYGRIARDNAVSGTTVLPSGTEE